MVSPFDSTSRRLSLILMTVCLCSQSFKFCSAQHSQHDIVRSENLEPNSTLLNETLENSTESSIVNLSNNTDQGKSIDWFKVENTFNQYLSDDELLQKWELMEANMKSGFSFFVL